MKKKIMILGVIAVVLLMVSCATAVPQIGSASSTEKIIKRQILFDKLDVVMEKIQNDEDPQPAIIGFLLFLSFCYWFITVVGPAIFAGIVGLILLPFSLLIDLIMLILLVLFL